MEDVNFSALLVVSKLMKNAEIEFHRVALTSLTRGREVFKESRYLFEICLIASLQSA